MCCQLAAWLPGPPLGRVAGSQSKWRADENRTQSLGGMVEEAAPTVDITESSVISIWKRTGQRAGKLQTEHGEWGRGEREARDGTRSQGWEIKRKQEKNRGSMWPRWQVFLGSWGEKSREEPQVQKEPGDRHALWYVNRLHSQPFVLGFLGT